MSDTGEWGWYCNARRFFWKNVKQEKRGMEVAKETLLVDDGELVMVMRLVMGEIFRVGVRTLVTIKWCVENGPRPVGRGLLNYVWSWTKVEMGKVHSVRALGSGLDDDDSNMLRVCRDMIILKDDPLFSNFSIAIVFICMTVGSDNATVILRSISHIMTD